MLKNQNFILEVINTLYDNNKFLFLNKCSENNKILIIDEMSDDMKLEALRYLKKFSSYNRIIEHLETFPEYDKKYEYLIEEYANKYKLNKEHLLFICENMNNLFQN